MTLEEKAKQRAKEIYSGEDNTSSALQGAVEKGYLAGAKEVEGENKLLPNENEDYFFVYGSGHSEYNNANNNEWLSMLRKCLEMKEQGIDVIQQLEQAKEIIKKLLTVDYPSTTLEECKTIHQQAEQFLQEIEK